MRFLTKAYYYLFYQLYRHYQSGGSIWWSEWKASLTLDVLQYFIFLSGLVYYGTFFNRNYDIGDGKLILLIVFAVIVIPNYIIFHSKDKWKTIVQEFDKLPKRKNQIGGWLILLFVLLVIANLVIAFYFMSQVDWKQYRK